MSEALEKFNPSELMELTDPRVLEAFRQRGIEIHSDEIIFPQGDIIGSVNVKGAQVEIFINEERNKIDIDIIKPGQRTLKLEIINNIPQIREL